MGRYLIVKEVEREPPEYVGRVTVSDVVSAPNPETAVGKAHFHDGYDYWDSERVNMKVYELAVDEYGNPIVRDADDLDR